MTYNVKIVNEHFRTMGSGNRPRHKLEICATDIKDAWRKAYDAVQAFNAAGGIVKRNCFGSDQAGAWADWKISDVVKCK